MRQSQTQRSRKQKSDMCIYIYIRSIHLHIQLHVVQICLFVFFSIITLALLFSLPPRRKSDRGSHNRLSSPLPTTVRAFIFIAGRRPQPLLPSSTPVKICWGPVVFLLRAIRSAPLLSPIRRRIKEKTSADFIYVGGSCYTSVIRKERLPTSFRVRNTQERARDAKKGVLNAA